MNTQQPRHWKSHGACAMTINDAGPYPDERTTGSVYSCNSEENRDQFDVYLSITAGAFDFMPHMTPGTARSLAAALLSAADECDKQRHKDAA